MLTINNSLLTLQCNFLKTIFDVFIQTKAIKILISIKTFKNLNTQGAKHIKSIFKHFYSFCWLRGERTRR